jgi:hypothetical protein
MHSAYHPVYYLFMPCLRIEIFYRTTLFVHLNYCCHRLRLICCRKNMLPKLLVSSLTARYSIDFVSFDTGGKLISSVSWIDFYGFSTLNRFLQCHYNDYVTSHVSNFILFFFLEHAPKCTPFLLEGEHQDGAKLTASSKRKEKKKEPKSKSKHRLTVQWNSVLCKIF